MSDQNTNSLTKDFFIRCICAKKRRVGVKSLSVVASGTHITLAAMASPVLDQQWPCFCVSVGIQRFSSCLVVSSRARDLWYWSARLLSNSQGEWGNP